MTVCVMHHQEECKCFLCSNIQPQSQYLVEPLFAANTVASLVGYVSNSFPYLETAICTHSSWQTGSSSHSVRLDGYHLWTAIFKSWNRFWINLRSGFWLGQSDIICLQPFQCSSGCKVNLHPIFRPPADWNRCSSRIALYLAPSILPSVLATFPVPADEKHLYSTMLPLLCFTEGMMRSGWGDVLGWASTMHSVLHQIQKVQFWYHLIPSCRIF